MRFLISALMALIVAIMICVPTTAQACTGFFIQAEDGGVAYARSNEFTADLKANIAVIPRGNSYSAQMPDGSSGLE